MRFTAARHVLVEAIARLPFSAAAVEVGRAGGVLWQEGFGTLTRQPSSRSVRIDSVFDLASLTKVIATTTAAMQMVDGGTLRLSDRVGDVLGEWSGGERESTTVEDLLSHSSGLPAWLPLYRDATGRDQYLSRIARTPFDYPPRTRSEYSDLGFILLGVLLERKAAMPLDRLFAGIRSRLDLGDIAFLPPSEWHRRTVATEFDTWRNRLLVGEVHDQNAAALGGVAGHAGLFGNVTAVGRFARIVLHARSGEPAACLRFARQDTVVRFTTRDNVPGSSRALGWDTMMPTSSCGTRLSSRAFGHTGFTGTSMWIDPEQDRYVVLLTNLVGPADEKRRLRRTFHDAVMEDVVRNRVGGL